MDQKARVRKAMDELAEAVDWGFDEIDASSMGPLGLARTMLAQMPLQQLLSLPGFTGSWLHMIAAEQHGAPVAGQVIVAAAFPPASMLAARETDEAKRSALAAGATVAIRPPDSELLVLSPVTADAVVYELNAGGMESIAGSVAELVEREVDVALGRRVGATLPAYGLDGDNWAVMIEGRRVSAPSTEGGMKRAHEAVRAMAAKTGLPLAYVHMGTTVGGDDERQTFDGIVGWVLAHASSRAPALVERAALSVAKIPDGFFETLASEHGLSYEESTGLHLAPGGWTGASLHADEDGKRADESFVQTWAEDTTAGKRLDVETLPERVWLRAQYA